MVDNRGVSYTCRDTTRKNGGGMLCGYSINLLLCILLVFFLHLLARITVMHVIFHNR